MNGLNEYPRVSVIIPYFNAEQTIERSIASVYQQTDVDVEIILVNDASTDRSYQVASETTQGKPVKHINLKHNAGAGSARNRGLALARSDFIQFLDADDALDARKLKKQVGLLTELNVAFIAGAYYLQHHDRPPTIKSPTTDGWMGLLLSELGRTSANLFSATALRAINGFNAFLKSSQEYDLMYRVLKNGGTYAVDCEPLTTIYSTKESISNSDVAGNVKRFLALRAHMIGYLEAAGKLTNPMKMHLKRHYQNILDDFPEAFKQEVWDVTMGNALDALE